MRIAKSQKNKYDACIYWFKACGDDINSADKISLFPFLNWHNEARHFADYCRSVGEEEVADKAVEAWN